MMEEVKKSNQHNSKLSVVVIPIAGVVKKGSSSPGRQELLNHTSSQGGMMDDVDLDMEEDPDLLNDNNKL